MSNETTAAIERGSSALSKHPLYGCGCCSDPEDYDSEHPDGCPREDGWTDHDYGDDCWKDQGRSAILTADVLAAALDVEEMAAVIWTASRADEGTISATGAKHIATALRAALLGGVS